MARSSERILKTQMNDLEKKIKNKSIKLAIIGLGYVGLPLALEFAKAGFKVLGIDKDKKRIESINKGISYVTDITHRELKSILGKNLEVTSLYNGLKNIDVIIICVPTPLRKTREPDISYILDATKGIKKYLKKNQLIILESTTYPGTTKEVILPILESTGFKVGKDFYLNFSPERIDPGNKEYNTNNIPKIIGGVTRRCAQLAKELYSTIVDKIILVSSTNVAEMVKLYENVFRNVNIALVNELMLMSDKLGVDIWEVIEAAKTKPFGFMPFYPGPGLGGHCIPVDPTFLTWRAKAAGFEARLVELATQINNYMPHYVVDKIQDGLNSSGKPIKGAKILILGITYKQDVSDIRESPALSIIELLYKKQAKVNYHDPYVGELSLDSLKLKSKRLTNLILKKSDCLVLVTPHSKFNLEYIIRNSKLLIDTRGVTWKYRSKNIIRL